MKKIAIEATGADHKFGVVLAGAKAALEKNPDLNLVLVAGKDKLPEYFCLNGIRLETTEFTYDSNAKGKQSKSSIYHAMELHKEGSVDAVICPGDTRGAVSSAHRILKYLPHVLGPAIPTPLPVNNVLIDSGANYEAEPENLYQSAIMGMVYARDSVRVENPLIGIITNGTEKNKGRRDIKRAKRLIDKLSGYGYEVSEDFFEGDFFEDLNAGVVGVTDGHTGNILLKGIEAASRAVKNALKTEIKNQSLPLRLMAYVGLYLPDKKLKGKFDYKKHSTAPLLGVNGNVMICHGKSDAEAIANAISITEKYLRCNINESLKIELEKYGKP